MGTPLQDQVEVEASEVGMEAGLREAGSFRGCKELFQRCI